MASSVPSADRPLHYSYDKPRQYCAHYGLRFHDDALLVADAKFTALGLTQEQVDEITCLYAWNMNWYWRPSLYTVRQRIGIALHFLFRR